MDDDTRRTLAADIDRVARITGEFTLRSGRTATEYFDKYQFEADPLLLARVAAGLVDLLPSDTEVLAGLELGGVPIATALSMRTGLPVVFVRKEAKAYGTARLAEGVEVDGRQVTVVEDVITSGGQVVISTGELRELGATVAHAVCAIDRGEGGEEALAGADITLHPLLRRTDLDLAREELEAARQQASARD